MPRKAPSQDQRISATDARGEPPRRVVPRMRRRYRFGAAVGRPCFGVASDGVDRDASGKPAVALSVPNSLDFAEGGVCIEPEVVSWHESANGTPPFVMRKTRSNSGVASEIIEP